MYTKVLLCIVVLIICFRGQTMVSLTHIFRDYLTGTRIVASVPIKLSLRIWVRSMFKQLQRKYEKNEDLGIVLINSLLAANKVTWSEIGKRTTDWISRIKVFCISDIMYTITYCMLSASGRSNIRRKSSIILLAIISNSSDRVPFLAPP